MIKEVVRKIVSELPNGVILVAAAKTRAPEEILQAIDAGVKVIGENYVQEAEAAFNVIGNKVKWHFIGHLQKNKVKKAIKIFDIIEAMDSFELAEEINKICVRENKAIEVFIEINSGKEKQKFGVMPEETEDLVRKLSVLPNVKVMGLMTMGPFSGNPEDARPYFKETKSVFEQIKSLNIPNVEMKYLSMGMSNSYNVAIEEGANIVRLGTRIFGER